MTIWLLKQLGKVCTLLLLSDGNYRVQSTNEPRIVLWVLQGRPDVNAISSDSKITQLLKCKRQEFGGNPNLQ